MSIIEAPREFTAPGPPPLEKPKPTEADVLERAAYGYEEELYGWHPGPGYWVDNNTCMVGAVMRAARELGFTFHKYDDDAHWFCYKRIGFGSHWNDEPGRTKEEVVSALREAAARARANV